MEVVKSILSLLEGVDQVSTAFSGERYSTLSLCCLCCLVYVIIIAKPDKNNNTFLSTFKQKFTEQLNL